MLFTKSGMQAAIHHMHVRICHMHVPSTFHARNLRQSLVNRHTLTDNSFSLSLTLSYTQAGQRYR